MAIIVQPIGPAANVPVVHAEVTAVDGCPVLDKLKAFLVEQGTTKVLEYVVRDRRGNPVNLATGEPAASSSSSSSSASASDSFNPAELFRFVTLRGRSALADGQLREGERILEAPGDLWDAAGGVVRAAVGPQDFTDRPGIYELDWGVTDENDVLLFTDRCFLSVERTLFGSDPTKVAGPPTLREIQLSIRDSRTENLWLDNVEFDAAELVQAIVRPVHYWNEVPPPIVRFRPDTFPFREHWLVGIQAYLFQTAAHHYRRAYLEHAAGGTALNDKKKEREYQAAGELLMKQYRDWVQLKKYEINLRGFVGSSRSTYSSRVGW